MRVTGDTPNMFDIYGDCCSPVWGTQEEAPKKIAAIEGDMETAKAVWGTQEEACNETAAVEGDVKTAIQARIESKRKAALDRKEALDNIRQAPMFVQQPHHPLKKAIEHTIKNPKAYECHQKEPEHKLSPEQHAVCQAFLSGARLSFCVIGSPGTEKGTAAPKRARLCT